MATEKRDSGDKPSAFLQLPVRKLGLKYVPAIPVDVRGMADTVSRLVIRIKQREQALQGLSKMFTIGGSTARAYNFLYGSGAGDKAGTVHSAKNVGSVPGAELATYVVEKGKPLVEMVK